MKPHSKAAVALADEIAEVTEACYGDYPSQNCRMAIARLIDEHVGPLVDASLAYTITDKHYNTIVSWREDAS